MSLISVGPIPARLNPILSDLDAGELGLSSNSLFRVRLELMISWLDFGHFGATWVIIGQILSTLPPELARSADFYPNLATPAKLGQERSNLRRTLATLGRHGPTLARFESPLTGLGGRRAGAKKQDTEYFGSGFYCESKHPVGPSQACFGHETCTFLTPRSSFASKSTLAGSKLRETDFPQDRTTTMCSGFPLETRAFSAARLQRAWERSRTSDRASSTFRIP